jgi:integrase/recombinase XerD
MRLPFRPSRRTVSFPIVLDKVILRADALARHRSVPLLREREDYIYHLRRTREQRRDAYSYLVQIVRQLALKRMRKMNLAELRKAADLWKARSALSQSGKMGGRASFLRYAKGWLRFHGKFIEPHKWNTPRDSRVGLYKKYIESELGFAYRTVENRVWSLNRFLKWLSENGFELRTVSAKHVEKYLDYCSAKGLSSTTVGGTAQGLKVFFRFAEKRRWCRKGVSAGIFGPRIEKSPPRRIGPQWEDVCRVSETAKTTNANECRAKAIWLLLSSFGLRSSEVTNLYLTDVDFNHSIITIRRSKNDLTQRLPLTGEVRSALYHFVTKIRPPSKFPHVFLTLRRPHQPIFQASVYNVTRNHMNRLNIVSECRGPHAIRHACANHLLEIGTSVPKVASLLGHASSRYVGAYLHHSIEQLRTVVDFELDIL